MRFNFSPKHIVLFVMKKKEKSQTCFYREKKTATTFNLEEKKNIKILNCNSATFLQRNKLIALEIHYNAR